MGVFQEYLKQPMTDAALAAERKRHLERISKALNAQVLVYAGNTSSSAGAAPTSIDYDDLLPFTDVAQDLVGDRIVVILETFGGAGEVGRDMVEILHERFSYVAFLVPGWAKSTGTIMAMGGHEIFMGPGSALGPIDAQLIRGDQVFSADALIEGLDAIKEEVEQTGQLNLAYYPILEKISPGEIQHARNALLFARNTVRDWLVKYKFSGWTNRRSTGEIVTDEYRLKRAEEIAEALSSQSRWFTHGRSLRIPDLKALKLDITDFSKDAELYDAVQRYHVLLRLTFEDSGAAKIFETVSSIVMRRVQSRTGATSQEEPDALVAGIVCPKCSHENRVQLDFVPGVPAEETARRWPNSNKLSCESCSEVLDLQGYRQQIEANEGRPALNPQPET